jgi:hypothetical protein
MKDGTKIQVRNKFWDNSPVRTVTYINGGIQTEKYWFDWNFFFEVNIII